MGVQGVPSKFDDMESDRIEEPLIDKANGRGYQIQPDSVISVPSSQDGSTVFGYNMGLRPFQDIIFSIIFLLLVIVTFGFGIYGVTHSNPDYQWIQSARYQRGEGCSIPEHMQLESSNTSKLWVFDPYTDLFSRKTVNDAAISNRPIWITLGLTLVFCVPLALGMLFLLRKYTKELVYATLPFFVLLPIALNITWFVLCQRDTECKRNFDSSGQYALFGFILLMCALMVYVIYSNWDRIELTIRIVKTASEALNQNLALVFILPALTLVLFLFCTPIITFMAYAYTNGKLVPNPDIVDHPETHCRQGTDNPCCVWEPALWVPYYLYLSGFAILWSGMIMAQIQVFTISGTVAQWYFAQAESSTVGTTMRSLRNAFGPSFGTACLAGLIVAIVRVIRGAMNKADNEQAQQGALSLLLRACLEWILQAVEFLTKFTSNFAAITGESFCASATMTYNLLKRNLLSTVLVEVISDRLLAMVVFVFSVIYALLICPVVLVAAAEIGMCVCANPEKVGIDTLAVAVAKVYGVLHLTTSLPRGHKLTGSVLSWAILLFVLILFVRVLSNVIDTVYISYAMDKDQGVVSKPDVHDVLVLLPASRDDNPTLAVRREN